MSIDDRHIPLEGSRNFRDFGGYPTRCGGTVKKGVLFRSDRLSNLSDQDLEILRPLGIRNICDLRRGEEREMSPTRWHEDAGTRNLHLPLIEDQGPIVLNKAFREGHDRMDEETARQVMVKIYRSMVTEGYALERLRRIFQLLASDEDVPVLIHCSGGKDRTGVSCALILSALGVDTEAVIEDYMHSQALYADRINLERAATQAFDHSGMGGWTPEALKCIYGVAPDYLQAAFDHITGHHGDVETFVRQALGLDDDDLARMRRNLIA